MAEALLLLEMENKRRQEQEDQRRRDAMDKKERAKLEQEEKKAQEIQRLREIAKANMMVRLTLFIRFIAIRLFSNKN